jgi:hypothetical protein
VSGEPRIAILTEEPGWHGAELRRALEARGAQVLFAGLRACRLGLAGADPPIVLPGFGNAQPDGVMVRDVPGGTLEQVVLRLDVLHALREQGVPVYNDARAIERTVDKAMTSFLLRRAGLPTPPTCVTESATEAAATSPAACRWAWCGAWAGNGPPRGGGVLRRLVPPTLH